MKGVNQIAALSLAIGVPNLASVPHSFARAFTNLLAIAAVTDITFERAKELKAFLADPSAFAAAHVSSSAPAGGSGGKVEESKKEEPKKDEEDDDVGLGGGLFGDD